MFNVIVVSGNLTPEQKKDLETIGITVNDAREGSTLQSLVLPQGWQEVGGMRRIIFDEKQRQRVLHIPPGLKPESHIKVYRRYEIVEDFFPPSPSVVRYKIQDLETKQTITAFQSLKVENEGEQSLALQEALNFMKDNYPNNSPAAYWSI